MEQSSFANFPDEIIEQVVCNLSPRDTIAFGLTCNRANKVSWEPVVWRKHCVDTWKHWRETHELEDKLANPPSNTGWRLLFRKRQDIDKDALLLFDQALQEQQHRIQRIEAIVSKGADVKDLFLRQRNETPDDAPDVLARRYFADVVLSKIHRAMSISMWTKVTRREMIRLEEAVVAFDLCALNAQSGDLVQVRQRFDELASGVKQLDPDFDQLSIRQKAVLVARHIRAEGLNGNEDKTEFYALRNNFITMALFESPHSSLPLQSAVIYCAVARRLGLNAKPSNYPQHVHAVVEAPKGLSLDGRIRQPQHEGGEDLEEPERMYMDPWRTDDEISVRALSQRLSQMGIPQAHHSQYLGPASNLEVCLRVARNITNSVQEARNRHQLYSSHHVLYPSADSARYGMLWAMVMLGDGSVASNLHRRRQCLPYLVEQYQRNFFEDLDLIERLIVPMFENEREHEVLLQLVTEGRLSDANKPAPSPRPQAPATDAVKYRVGTHFRHRRYQYTGVIIGWNARCHAGEEWIAQMSVDTQLERGRHQPFYNVVGDDRSQRYVAEENIDEVSDEPNEALMAIAGRYFKRWDAEAHRFVSNRQDEYPDD